MVFATILSPKVAPTLIFLSAILVYANTFHAGFTFDDNFAVVNNKDVTDSASPWLNLLLHDFWGQDIRSDSSHKSYRPVTVLSFRVIWLLWHALPADIRSSLPTPPDAFPFHLVNVLLHGAASILVYWLAHHLFSCKEAAFNRLSWATLRSAPARQPPVQHGAETDSSLEGLPSKARQAVRVQSLLCGLAFALHPVHSEAVSGIVGQAEELCAVFGILGLMDYFKAAEGRYLTAAMFSTPEERTSSTTKEGLWGSHTHWRLLLQALVWSLLAAFSKEVGITMIGCMMVYELLDLGLPLRHLHLSRVYPAGAGKDRSVRVPKQLKKSLLRRKLLRLMMCALTAVGYVKVRSWVAGDHLVRIYRQVENPIPFSEDPWTRAWSTGWLHTSYFSLLVFPLNLSADWSYACIPLVETWHDWRNSLTFVLYSCIMYCLMATKCWDPDLLFLGLWETKPVGTSPAPPVTSSRSKQNAAAAAARDAANSAADVELPGAATDVALYHCRWIAGVLVGLMVAPFCPASNILFYVGTVIGERLLYLPSVGFCILMASFAFEITRGKSQTTTLPSAPTDLKQGTEKGSNSTTTADANTSAASTSDSDESKIDTGGSWLTTLLRLLVYTLFSLLLGWYCARTFGRNWDWESEESLFLSALKVCPDSAKVQLNNGILQRRFHNMDAALKHFHKARKLVPSYCETAYWIGITLLNKGKMDDALVELQSAISCKYVAVESVMALNTIFKVLKESSPGDVSPMLRWGQVLLHPDLDRLSDACVVLEEAALVLAADHRNLTGAFTATQYCLESLKSKLGPGPQDLPLQERIARAQSRALDKPAAGIPPTDAELRQLYECVKARSIVFGAVAKHGLLSKSVKRHMYRYLHSLAATCRVSTLGPTLHTQLVNRLQSADAYDPWLHMEWAEVLAANHPPRIAEGCTHLQAAAALLLSVPLKPDGQVQEVNPPPYRPVPGAPTQILALDGEGPVEGLAAVEASIRTLQRALELGTGHIDTCLIMSNLCEARLQLLQLLKAGTTAYTNAQATAGACMQELFSNRNCHAQHARFAQLQGHGGSP